MSVDGLLTPQEWATWALLGDDCIRTVPVPLQDLHARIVQAIVQDRREIRALHAKTARAIVPEEAVVGKICGDIRHHHSRRVQTLPGVD